MSPTQEAFSRLESMNVLSALSKESQEYWENFKEITDSVFIQLIAKPIKLDCITTEQRVNGYTFHFFDANGVSHSYQTTRFQTFYLCEKAWLSFKDKVNGKSKMEETTDL